MSITVEEYLDELGDALRVGRRRRTRVLEETRDHLDDAIDAGRANGLDDRSALERAIERFGTVGDVARCVNASNSTDAMRRWPAAAVTVAALIAVALVVAAHAPPSSTHAPAVTVAAFWVGGICAELATVCGVLMAARLIMSGRRRTIDGTDAAVIRRTSWVLFASEAAAALSLAFVVVYDGVERNSMSLVYATSAGVMLAAGALGAILSVRTYRFEPIGGGGAIGEPVSNSTVQVRNLFDSLHRHRVTSCAAVALGSSVMVSRHSETTIASSLPWALAQMGAVVVLYVTLGGYLGIARDVAVDA